MNVFLLKKILFSVAMAVFLPLVGFGQIDTIVTYRNQTATRPFVSIPNAPNILDQPDHGQAGLVANTATSYSFDHILTYTPDPDFVGMDQFVVVYWSMPSSGPQYKLFNVYVQPAAIEANHDFVTMNENSTVIIPVTENDNSSNGTIILTSVPVANNGTTTLLAETGEISFTPRPGFVGLAHFNYVICNGDATCDHGTVSVNVMPETMGENEIMTIFTKKNKPQDVLVPHVYTLLSGPEHGIYDPAEEVPQYLPATDYTGSDQLVFAHDGSQITINIEVLDVEENTFAYDDDYYTTSKQTLEFDVLENDLYGHNANSVSIAAPQSGSIEVVGEGQVVYTPAPGFSGVDQFTYSSRSPSGLEEVATVYVHVSNFEPTSTKFKMLTPKRTPLVIGYDVPVNTFQFEITQQGELGEAVFFPGQVDMEIYDVPITGYNLIIYIPNEEVDAGLDEFEVSYCVLDPDGGPCTFEKTVKVEMEILNIGAGQGPMCFGDCVWAGDTNFDGVVNMEDLLPLGLMMGEIGTARPDVTFNYWYGQYSPDWQNLFAENPVNLKHLDADGDSIVTALDTAAISQFYGRTHSLTATKVPYYEYEIQLEGDLFVSPGDYVELKMKLGSPADPAIDIYGFTFPFEYNKHIFVPSSVKIGYNANSWLSYSSPVLFMSRNNQHGKVESGFTRTNGFSASGHGEIGSIGFIVSDDIIGFRIDEDEIPVKIGGGQATGMTSSGQNFGINIGEYTLHIVLNQEEDDNGPIPAEKLKVFPNPTSGYLNLHLNGGSEFERVVIYSVAGQQLFDSGPMLTHRAQFNVSNLQSGIYFMQVSTPKGVINKKIEIIK